MSDVLASAASARAGMAQVFTDFAGLDRLKGQARENDAVALKEVAQQFEAIFLNIVLKSMRAANQSFAEGNYFNSQQGDMYRDMLDQQLSLTLSQGQGIGLARSLVDQLGMYLRNQPAPAEGATRTSGRLAVNA